MAPIDLMTKVITYAFSEILFLRNPGERSAIMGVMGWASVSGHGYLCPAWRPSKRLCCWNSLLCLSLLSVSRVGVTFTSGGLKSRESQGCDQERPLTSSFRTWPTALPFSFLHLGRQKGHRTEHGETEGVPLHGREPWGPVEAGEVEGRVCP